MSVDLTDNAPGVHGRSNRVVDASVIERIREVSAPEALAVVLYGSQARGTATQRSDVDVLELVHSLGGTRSVENISITSYTPAALTEMASRGSLFVLHLRVDSIVISDSNGEFNKALAQYREPSSYNPLLDEVRLAASALKPASDSARYASSLDRLGNYLTRTTLYAKLAAAGDPTFDVPAACMKLNLQSVTEVLQGQKSKTTSGERIARQLQAIEDLLGEVEDNPHGSIEGLAIDSASSQSLHGQLLAGVIAPSNDSINYATLVPPAL